jgi:hypothetical protein
MPQVYNAGAAPVEDYYRRAGVLLDFEITGGIPETTPRLMAALAPHIAQAAARAPSSDGGVAGSQVEQEQQQQQPLAAAVAGM